MNQSYPAFVKMSISVLLSGFHDAFDSWICFLFLETGEV